MALIATQADMQGGWYRTPGAPPEGHYADGMWVDARVQRLVAKAFSGKVLVAGCGYGFLVRKLRLAGIDAWGIDASTWAVSQDVTGGFVKLGNVLIRSELNAIKSAAGLTGGQKFAACVTEDLLTCLTDAEIATSLTELGRVSQRLYHMVTDDFYPNTTRDPAFNWKPLSGWKALVGTDLVYGFESQMEA